MKLKSQMEKQKIYAMKQRNEAKKAGDTQMEWYWLGVYQSMDWAPGSREDWTYIDGEKMLKDEKLEW